MGSESILERPVPSGAVRIRYGAEANRFGDLRLPAPPGPHPCAVVIHGGFWRAQYDLEHVGHLCHALAGAGVATWNVEYRRVGETGGGWPGTLRDVERAGGFLFEEAARYGVDPERVIVLGHSAGGQLALWLAGRRRGGVGGDGGGTPLPLRGAVSLAGVLDLRRAWALGLSDGAVEAFLGGTPDVVPERSAAASPREGVPLGVRQVLVHGTADEDVPVSMSEGYREAAVEAGDEASLLLVPGAGHFDLIDPESEAWPTVLGAITGSLGT